MHAHTRKYENTHDLSLILLCLGTPPLSLLPSLAPPTFARACEYAEKISLKLYLSAACSLVHSLSLCLSLSDSLSLFNNRFPWLAEIGSTRHASTPLLVTSHILLVSLFLTMSGASRHRDWYYLPALLID